MNGPIAKSTGLFVFTLALTACDSRMAADAENRAVGTGPTADEAASKSEPDAQEPQLSTSASPAPIDCDDTTIMACTVSGGKQLRVCAAEDGNLTYRFGPANGPPELTLDASPDFATVAYSGGGESQIRFTSGLADYIVFSRVVRTGFGEEGNQPEMTDGVMVIQDGIGVATRLCEGEVYSVDINALSNIAPARSELFTD